MISAGLGQRPLTAEVEEEPNSPYEKSVQLLLPSVKNSNAPHSGVSWITRHYKLFFSNSFDYSLYLTEDDALLQSEGVISFQRSAGLNVYMTLFEKTFFAGGTQIIWIEINELYLTTEIIFNYYSFKLPLVVFVIMEVEVIVIETVHGSYSFPGQGFPSGWAALVIFGFLFLLPPQCLEHPDHWAQVNSQSLQSWLVLVLMSTTMDFILIFMENFKIPGKIKAGALIFLCLKVPIQVNSTSIKSHVTSG